MRRLPIVLAAMMLCSGVAAPWPPAMLDSRGAGLVDHGRQLYASHCASCHGRNLQGQPLWRMVDSDQHRRAPALDATGPAWLLSDAALVATVSAGRLAAGDAPSRMPAFATSLSDGDITAVLAFIKARWPVAMRVTQSTLNPGSDRSAGEPGDWRFPPDCRALTARR